MKDFAILSTDALAYIKLASEVRFDTVILMGKS